jgi:ubiquinone/menaquinone biosynthesis C-methylase UbiE
MDITRMALNIFDRYAVEYQHRFMNVDRYREALDLFCSSIPEEHAEVLELACGPGNITRYLLDRCPRLRILGTDLAPHMIELARRNNPEAEFEIMDCREISRIGRTFHGIVCGFGLPYLSREEAVKLAEDCSVLLKPGGVLYWSTMEDDYSRSGLQTARSGDTIYIYYHQEDYLREALLGNGFTILETQRLTYEENGKETTDLVMVAGRQG